MELLLFLVSASYVSIIFATGHVSERGKGAGFDKHYDSEVLSKPDQHIIFLFLKDPGLWKYSVHGELLPVGVRIV